MAPSQTVPRGAARRLRSACSDRHRVPRLPSRPGYREQIRSERIPDVKEKNAAVTQHTLRLSHRCGFVGNKHVAELADDRVERIVAKWKRRSVGLLPSHVFIFAEFRLCELEHVDVE